MKRKFQLKDGTTDKFWHIDLLYNGYTSYHGDTGTEGKKFTSTHRFKEDLNKFYEAAIESMKQKGYVEITAPPAPVPDGSSCLKKADEYWILEPKDKMLITINQNEYGEEYIYTETPYQGAEQAIQALEQKRQGLLEKGFTPCKFMPELKDIRIDPKKIFEDFLYFEDRKLVSTGNEIADMFADLAQPGGEPEFKAVSKEVLVDDKNIPYYQTRSGRLHTLGKLITHKQTYQQLIRNKKKTYQELSIELEKLQHTYKNRYIEKPIDQIEIHLEEIKPLPSKIALQAKQEAELKKKIPIQKHQVHLTALEELDLGQNPYLQIHVIAGLTTLQKLSLCPLSCRDLDFLEPLINLTYLDISQVEARRDDALNKLKKLKHLHIKSARSFTILDEKPDLIELGIHDGGSLEFLRHPCAKQLKKLTYRNAWRQSAPALTDCTALEALDLSNNHISDISSLAGSGIKSLNLAHNKISNIKCLTTLLQLTELNLNFNNIKAKTDLAILPGRVKVYIKTNLDGHVFESESLVDSNGNIKGQWPDCVTKVNDLAAMNDQAEHAHIDSTQNDSFPIIKILFLGEGKVSAFMECPHIPEHNSGYDALTIDSGNGSLYWFDFRLLSRDQTSIPLRMTYCLGNADCNDGMWGAVWRRDTFEKMADIESTGDCETTISAAFALINTYKPHNNLVLPAQADLQETYSFIYKHDAEVEKALGIAIWQSRSLRDEKEPAYPWLKKPDTSGDSEYIFFEDPLLEKIILELLKKEHGPILKKEVQRITSLAIRKKSITKLTGIEYFTNLTKLDLSGNLISDLKPLSGLKGLKVLILRDNKIKDITPL
ncbi:MAG: leucine-rich repeat domain-containing protein [Spirochaetales bacterium]|nr:leucine-rich repeat domain-containing protein [Spirochaetales bacterium]